MTVNSSMIITPVNSYGDAVKQIKRYIKSLRSVKYLFKFTGISKRSKENLERQFSWVGDLKIV